MKRICFLLSINFIRYNDKGLIYLYIWTFSFIIRWWFCFWHNHWNLKCKFTYTSSYSFFPFSGTFDIFYLIFNQFNRISWNDIRLDIGFFDTFQFFTLVLINPVLQFSDSIGFNCSYSFLKNKLSILVLNLRNKVSPQWQWCPKLLFSITFEVLTAIIYYISKTTFIQIIWKKV